MSTKLDQKFANEIIEGVKALKFEVERLESYCEQLENKLAVAVEVLVKISKMNPNDLEICAAGEMIICKVREALAKIKGEE